MEENKSQIIIYQTENGETKLDVHFQDETVWLTQKLMAEFFQTTSQNITIHLKNIFEEGELEEDATSVDYDPTLDISIDFFKTVQNKMHWAITGQTAAEIISLRGDKIRKADVSIAKNYLNEDELTSLNNLVEQYLIFAQGQAMRRIPMYMKDWIEKLNGFLTLNDREILNSTGSISHTLAKENAEREYEKFKDSERKMITEGDFEKAIKKIEQQKKK